MYNVLANVKHCCNWEKIVETLLFLKINNFLSWTRKYPCIPIIVVCELRTTFTLVTVAGWEGPAWLGQSDSGQWPGYRLYRRDHLFTHNTNMGHRNVKPFVWTIWVGADMRLEKTWILVVVIFSQMKILCESGLNYLWLIDLHGHYFANPWSWMPEDDDKVSSHVNV